MLSTLNKRATAIFSKLVEGLTEDGTARKIDNTKGVFMAVSVDRLCTWKHPSTNGTLVKFAVAHRYEQNGDLVPDPDVEFLAVYSGSELLYVMPLAIEHVGRYVRSVELDEIGCPHGANVGAQRDLTSFVNQVWFPNIKRQQGL